MLRGFTCFSGSLNYNQNAAAGAEIVGFSEYLRLHERGPRGLPSPVIHTLALIFHYIHCFITVLLGYRLLYCHDLMYLSQVSLFLLHLCRWSILKPPHTCHDPALSFLKKKWYSSTYYQIAYASLPDPVTISPTVWYMLYILYSSIYLLRLLY
jgi:hypothetical protein